MRSDRRVLLILLLVAVVALPAGVIRALCLGDSCATEDAPRRPVPYCSLPANLRAALSNGYRKDRSPDVFGIAAREVPIVDAATGTLWPTVDDPSPNATIVMHGAGVPRADLAAMAIEDVAPTLAQAIGFEIPHPEVRSGRPLETIGPESANIVLLVVVKGLAADDAESDPELRELASDGSATFSASISSLPLDPAALLATIGTGGLPSEHGVTASYFRTDDGTVTKAWSRKPKEPTLTFPDTIIATLADDLDEETKQRSLIGLFGTEPIDRGLIGGNWYIDVDRDLIRIESNVGATIGRRTSSLVREFGSDATPDILAVALDTTPRLNVGQVVRMLYARMRRVSGGALVLAVVALPASEESAAAISSRVIQAELVEKLGVDVVERAVVGGFFLDQSRLSDEGLAGEDVVAAMRELRLNQERVLADAFTGFAISLAEFC